LGYFPVYCYRSLLDVLEGDNRYEPVPKIDVLVSDNEGLYLFFEVAFKGDNVYLGEIRTPLFGDSGKFRNELYEYPYKYPGNTEIKELYDRHPITGVDFNKKIRDLFDALLTEHLIYCGWEKLIEIYSTYFSDPSERGFLEYVTSVILESFIVFKNGMKNFAVRVNTTGTESDLRDFYRNILEGNFPPPDPSIAGNDNIPPHIDEVELRENIDIIAEESFGVLRQEYLMSFPYRRNKWEPHFYKIYCHGNQKIMADKTVKKKFDGKMRKIAKDICDFSTTNKGGRKRWKI
jgi:hypothetical protein